MIDPPVQRNECSQSAEKSGYEWGGIEVKRFLFYYPANDKGLTEDIVPTPQYALIDKSDFWRGVPNYENIDYIG